MLHIFPDVYLLVCILFDNFFSCLLPIFELFVFSLLSLNSSLYILEYSLLLDMLLKNIFFHSVESFIPWTGHCIWQAFLMFMQCNLSMLFEFCFYFCQKLVEHVGGNIFLNSLFCFIDLFLPLCQYHLLFITGAI